MPEDHADEILPTFDEPSESEEVEVEEAPPAPPKAEPEVSGSVWDHGPRTGGRYKLNENGERVRV